MLMKAYKNGDGKTIAFIAKRIQEYCDNLTIEKKKADTSKRTDAVAVRMVSDIEKVLNKYRTNLTDLDDVPIPNPKRKEKRK